MLLKIQLKLYVRKTDLLNKPKKAELHKRKRGNDDVKRDTPSNNDGKGHAKAGPLPDSEPNADSSTLVFIDGSCLRPGKPDARAGYGIVFPHQEDYNVFRKLEGSTQTNNRAELTAFIEANRIIDETLDPEKKSKKVFYTDCMLLVGMVQGGIKKRNIFGWKKTSNADLLKRIGEIAEENSRRLTVIHVYSHTGGDDWKSKWNDEADKLAKMGADLHGQHYNGSISELISNGPVYASRGYSRPQMCMIRPIVRRSFTRYGT